MLTASWQRAWAALGAEAPGALYERLLASYAEPQRKYHTLQHLAECLDQLTPVLPLAEQPGEVEVALWFHDAIYDLKRQDNELRSAAWARQALEGAGLAPAVAQRVSALVMATQHSALPETPDARLVVDLDLAILGAAPARFAEYEAQIQQEYAWVPGWLFRRKRRAVLQQFLERPRIYGTPPLHARYEAQARHNLQNALGLPRPGQ